MEGGNLPFFLLGENMTQTNVEYADWNITVYPAPCPFNCKYRWSQQPIWKHRTKWANSLREAKALKNTRKPLTVVVSFTTDPYQPRELTEELTQQTIMILSETKHKIMILTKSILVERDFPLFIHATNIGAQIWVGTTLTSVVSIEDEPLAPSNQARMKMLREAHQLGLPTWASIEPWIPDKTYPRQIIEATHEFVDWYVIGRLNYETRFGYDKIPKGYYRKELKRVRALFDELGFSLSDKPCKKGFHIKRELEKNP